MKYKFPNGEIIDCGERYYPASCNACGWQGSSGKCIADDYGDDSDVYCPKCHAGGADCGKVSQQAEEIQEKE